MTKAVDAHSVLKLLAAEFQRSKQEQIERFLKDQEDLNSRFSEFSTLHVDVENHNNEEKEESSDDSDTASVFTQRMSLYKSRPQTAIDWSGNDRRNHARDPTQLILDDVDSDSDDWQQAAASASRHHQQDVTVTHRDTNQPLATSHHRQNVTQTGHINHVTSKIHQDIPPTLAARQQLRNDNKSHNVPHPPESRQQPQTIMENQVIEPRQPPGPLPEHRLLSRRTTRPRTASEARHLGLNNESVHVDSVSKLNEDGHTTSRQRVRASAPASMSRAHRVSFEQDMYKATFLPDTRQNDTNTLGLSQTTRQPSYAMTNNNRLATPTTTTTNPGNKPTTPSGDTSNKFSANSRTNTPLNKTKQNSLESNNCMIISTLTPQTKNTMQSLDAGNNTTTSSIGDRKVDSRYQKLPRVNVGDLRKATQMASLRLPPLSQESANDKSTFSQQYAASRRDRPASRNQKVNTKS